MPDTHPTAESLFDLGLPIRREVLGAEYVDKAMDGANDFMMAFQHATTEIAWGYAWGRPGLDRKTRSLLNLAMLTALRAHNELKLHVKGAITNGVTVDEIKETLLHTAAYCGIPAALEAFKAANEVLVAGGHIPAVKTSVKTGVKTGAKTGVKTPDKKAAKKAVKPAVKTTGKTTGKTK